MVALSLVPDPLEPGALDLFVLIAVSLRDDAVSAYFPFVEKVARDLGARRIRFRSSRPGWCRSLSNRWRLSHVEYVTEVQDGEVR